MSLDVKASKALKDGMMLMSDMNREFEAPFRTFLERVIQDDHHHARFLNLLSMLEGIGRDKIAASYRNYPFKEERPRPDIERHLAEENGHREFFKRAGEELCSGAGVMAFASGASYFMSLDKGLSGRKENKKLDGVEGIDKNEKREKEYLLVSYVIELRALWVYKMYADILKEAQHPLSLEKVIGEEDGHLIDMAERLDRIGYDAKARLEADCLFERALFARLCRQLDREIAFLPPRPQDRFYAEMAKTQHTAK